MPSIQISDFLYTEASAVAQRHGIDPDQVIEQWARAGMKSPTEGMKRFLAEAPAAGADVDIKKLIEDGRS